MLSCMWTSPVDNLEFWQRWPHTLGGTVCVMLRTLTKWLIAYPLFLVVWLVLFGWHAVRRLTGR